MAIRENSTVKVISGPYKDKTGKVVKIHDFAGIAIIHFDNNGGVGKVSLSILEDTQAEIPEGAKQITKDEFRNAIQKITSPEAIFSDDRVDHSQALIDGLSAIMFGIKMERILFEDKDSVILTENDLVGTLWNACSPLEEINNKASALEGLYMSVASVIVLKDLVTILFDESENG